MTPRSLLAFAATLALLSGCTGLPPGAADVGDAVAVRYTLTDADGGQVIREDATASFLVGSGGSGLGVPFELAARGVSVNETGSAEYRYDPMHDYAGVVEANRTLAPIPILQSAPRSDFEQYVGPAAVGVTFPAYGIYTGVVTDVATETVSFRIDSEDGQEDPVPSVGATLVTHVGATHLARELRPNVGATFYIAPPSQFQTSTPLGLDPGSYKTLGAAGDKILYSTSADPNHDLIGRTLRVDVTVVQVEPQAKAVPTDNFGVRDSPQVKGNTDAALGEPLPSGESSDHVH